MRKGEDDHSMHLLHVGEAVMFAGTKSNRLPWAGWPIIGLVDVLEGRRKGKAMSLVLKGTMFGDAELMSKSATRKINVVARTPCMTYALQRHAFDEVLRWAKFD